MHGRNVLWVMKSRPLLLLESYHLSLFMHFNQLCSLIYYNLLFVNIMKNHFNLKAFLYIQITLRVSA